jgi:hypothetical protein
MLPAAYNDPTIVRQPEESLKEQLGVVLSVP